MKSKYENKVLVSKFRARNRDIWNEDDIKKFSEQSYENRSALHDQNLVDQHIFELSNQKLSKRTHDSIMAQSTYCSFQEKTLQSLFTDDDELISRYDISNNSMNYPDYSYICWIPNENMNSKTQIKSLYDDILQAMNFETNNIENQYNTNATNSNVPQTIQQISENPNEEQKRIIDKFEEILNQDISSTIIEIDKPPIFLLTGASGAGKSYTVRLIMEKAKELGKTVIGTSYNGIAALNIDGDTLCGLLHQSSGTNNHNSNKFIEIQDLPSFTFEQKYQFKQNLQLESLSLLIIDEISTVSPLMLGTLDIRMRQANENLDKPFGGIPVLFVGDFSQLPPVIGDSLTKGLFKMMKGEHIIEKWVWQRGCNIFKQSQWFHLTKQQRSNDNEHIQVLTKMGKGKRISFDDLNIYNFLSKEDLQDTKWLNASFLVSTNIERYNIIKLMAPQVAKKQKTHVFCWPNDTRNWEGKPFEYIEIVKKILLYGSILWLIQKDSSIEIFRRSLDWQMVQESNIILLFLRMNIKN